MSRHRSSSKRAPPEIGLHMECVEEELEPAQWAYYNKAEKEYNEIQNKLDNYVKKMKAEVVEKGENCFVLQLKATPPSSQISTPPTSVKTTRQSAQNYQQVVGQGILTRSTANSAGSTYLVMDPRLGFMVGQVQPPNVPERATPTSARSVSSRTRQAAALSTVMVTTRAKSSLKKQASTATEPEVLTPPMTRTRDKAKNQAQVQQSTSPQTSPQINHHHQQQQQQQVYSTANTSNTSGNYRIKVNAKPLPPPAKPTENNALGGLSAGSKTPWKPSIEEGNKADSREVTFNKVTGKTFPSLVVVARPHLKVKYIPQSTVTQERTALDAKVKGVLMFTSTKFTEWLIQQGLIRSQQICQTHVNNDLSPVKLKLGMYSDVSKFPYSGGYVWISDCCPSQFVSVFSGSIFEGAPHPPTTLLKLIYHWACQTNVQNVVQWVKVDNLYLKNFFTYMRAVCTQAVHENYKKLGGPRKKVEVGVISLGTTSQDGNRRQVKVEVLGVMDHENKLIRLKAVEPLSEERSFKRRFVKILEPLEDWVHKESTILTDFTVAKAALNSMGFHTVFQVTSDTKFSNQNVMEYLRRIVPRMFQNTLSLLSRQIIQQFLDELVWREMWGPIASQAFVNIITHMAEQTKLDVTENFLARVNKVASNPFKRWNYSVWKPISNSVSNTKIQQGASSQDSITSPSADSTESPNVVKGIRTRKRAAEQSASEAVVSPPPPKKVPKVVVKEKVKKEEKLKVIEKTIKKEPGDKLAEEFFKSINEGKQIPLESYYYGSLIGDEQAYQYKGPFSVKCCVCNKRFTENIVLMKHMILHCQLEPALVIDLKKVLQCESCFLGFNAASPLKTHEEEVHSLTNNKINSNLLCQICEEKFSHRNHLVYHMQKTHIEREMPYECGVCRFRTSVYKVFVDHFTQTHKGEEHIFCPYCLKVVTVSYKGVPIPQNVSFYMVHLEKHQRLSLIQDCNYCQLSFIHKGIWSQHMEADHCSWKNEKGIQPIKELPVGILMPEPTWLKPSAAKTYKAAKTKNLFTVNKFKALSINGLTEDMACIECEGSLTKFEHFSGSFNCLKCRYATCCERAMSEHSAIFHEVTNPQFTMGKPIVLPEEMFCVCEYSTSSGNRIAKHVAICERKSAYSSKESAATAVQYKSPTDKIQEKIKQGEGQNVLNMLGLVRKSPESTPAGSDTMKKEVEEEIATEIDVKEEKQDIEALEEKSEEELQEKSETEEQERSEAEVRERPDAEVQEKPETEEQERFDAEVQERFDAEVQERSDAEAQDISDAEIREKPEAEEQEKFETEVQEKPEAEEQEKSEAEVQEKCETELREKPEAQEQEKSEAEQEKSEAEEQEKSEAEEQEKSEAKEQEKSEGEEKKKSEVDLHEKSEVEILEKSETEKPDVEPQEKDMENDETSEGSGIPVVDGKKADVNLKLETEGTVTSAEVIIEDVPIEEVEDSSKESLDTPMEITEEEKDEVVSLKNFKDLNERKTSGEDEEEMEVDEEEFEEEKMDSNEEEKEVESGTVEKETESSPQEVECESKENIEGVESPMDVDETVERNEQESKDDMKPNCEVKIESEEIDECGTHESLENEEVSDEKVKEESEMIEIEETNDDKENDSESQTDVNTTQDNQNANEGGSEPEIKELEEEKKDSKEKEIEDDQRAEVSDNTSQN